MASPTDISGTFVDERGPTACSAYQRTMVDFKDGVAVVEPPSPPVVLYALIDPGEFGLPPWRHFAGAHSICPA
jgi:hypothetical protein